MTMRKESLKLQLTNCQEEAKILLEELNELSASDPNIHIDAMQITKIIITLDEWIALLEKPPNASQTKAS